MSKPEVVVRKDMGLRNQDDCPDWIIDLRIGETMLFEPRRRSHDNAVALAKAIAAELKIDWRCENE
jgi:hypothetical protein